VIDIVFGRQDLYRRSQMHHTWRCRLYLSNLSVLVWLSSLLVLPDFVRRISLCEKNFDVNWKQWTLLLKQYLLVSYQYWQTTNSQQSDSRELVENMLIIYFNCLLSIVQILWCCLVRATKNIAVCWRVKYTECILAKFLNSVD
jgi:hypothetical protein